MADLEDVPAAALHDLLAAHGDVPTQRLVAALLVKHGVPKARVAAALDVSRRTVYNWLERFEAGALDEAAFDAPRPGAPGKLAADERGALEETLAGPPAAAGYDAADWTAALVQRHVRETYGVEYTRRHARRLLP